MMLPLGWPGNADMAPMIGCVGRADDPHLVAEFVPVAGLILGDADHIRLVDAVHLVLGVAAAQLQNPLLKLERLDVFLF